MKEGEYKKSNIIVHKLKSAYVLTPEGEFVGPVKVVGPIMVKTDETGAVIEKKIRAYGPDTPPQGSGWMVYKEVHLLKPGNRLL